MLLFYDIETFDHDWLMVVVDTLSEKEYVFINDREGVKKFYEEHKNCIWVGFNSRSFDTWVLRAILAGYNPQDMTKFIIRDGKKGFEFDKSLSQIQLYNYDARWSGVVAGLKTLEAFMGSSIEESDVPFDIDRKLTPEEIQQTVEYCRYDVYQTIRVFTNSIQEFESHWGLIKEFDLPLACISKTQAQLAAIILGAVREKRNDEWLFDVEEPCNLIKKNKHVVDWFQNPLNRRIGASFETEVGGAEVVYAWGGGHGAIRNYFAEGKFIFCDVTSYYPSLMLQWAMLSRNCKHPEKFERVFGKNLEYKLAGDKKKREPYKRVCNITYGASSDEFNNLFDPRQAHRVCMNGQLFLTLMIEMLDGICKPVNVNTDGVLFHIEDESKLDDYYRICKEWEKLTKVDLEYEVYTKIWQRDVNNYLWEHEKGYIKNKGAVVKNLSVLDYDLKIVNEAVKNWFVNKIPPEKTVQDNKNMLDFQKVFKVSMKYKEAILGCSFRYETQVVIDKKTGKEKNAKVKVWNGDGTPINDKCNRVFASTEKMGMLFKKKDGKNPEKFANCPENCFIENGEIKGKSTDEYPNLDKQWYIDHAWYRINQFEGKVK